MCFFAEQNFKYWILNINETQGWKQSDLIFLQLHLSENKHVFLDKCVSPFLDFLLLQLTDIFEMVPVRWASREWHKCVFLSVWRGHLKGLKGKASVPIDDLILKTRHCRDQHSMAFHSLANTDVCKGSFLLQTNRDWNALPDSLISSAEDAEDCVAKFTSLVRDRD